MAATTKQSDWEVIWDVFNIWAMAARPEKRPAGVSLDWPVVKAAIGGDGDAFGQIVSSYQETIASQMRRFSKDQAVLEELVHDVFVEAFFSLKTFRGEAKLLHWLRKIAVRVGYRYWNCRSDNEVSLSDVNVELEPVASVVGSEEASDRLERVLGLLRPRDRLVLTLIYWDGCTIAEAAELSGWSCASVKVQAHRARERLRKLIEGR
jgi:RNA polymerase sigma-70 factor (ECF subfamily)